MNTKFCKRCFYHSEHPLGLFFDEEGVCSGCRIHEEKDSIDWCQKWNELKVLVDGYKSKNKNNFDCIVPVSGGKDSFFILDVVKNKLGLNPLLVSYNKHYNTPEGIARLARLKTVFNCDTISSVVSPHKIKKINRVTLKHMGSIYWSNIAGETVFPVQVAVKMRIPLIIWGAHQGLDQVGMFSHLDKVEMTRRYRKDHDLMGVEAEDLLKMSNELTEDDVDPFIYPDENEISSVGVRGIYLNNYMRWDSKLQHEQMMAKFSYQSMPQHRTFDTYNNIDCAHYSSLHDYIKFVKHGYSKVVDHATRELRLKRISRDTGIKLINEYIQKNDLPDFDLFCDWACISRNEVKRLIESFASPTFWTKVDGGIKFKYDYNKLLTISDANKLPVDPKLSNEWMVNRTGGNENEAKRSDYILIGKGHKLNHSHYQNI